MMNWKKASLASILLVALAACSPAENVPGSETDTSAGNDG